ncbi:unnamed protein product [Meganyctiphanes norvegica]|uniref:3-hydroxyisobutyrate dehydrogenase n=1 Tax=Meganyctiphanes norvegica TaxID=48144 RepID=A0AAV2QBE0_MEGNR
MWSRIRVTSPFLRRVVSHRSFTTATKDTRIGIVGCGNVGQAVTKNLIGAGFNVVSAYDIDTTRVSALGSSKIKEAKTPREVVENVDVLITGLPIPSAVRAASEGPDGILEGLTKDKIWIDHSTTDYEQTLSYNSIALDKGAHILEAPITGGMRALKKGNMVVFIGGEKALSDAMQPILQVNYSAVYYIGPMGTAMITKVVSNMLNAVGLIAAGEALMLAKKSGIDMKTYWEAIRVSSGNSFVWETGVPEVYTAKYDPSFSMELHCKDLQLGHEFAQKFRVPMAMNQLALSIFRQAQYQYGDDAGCYSAPKLLEDALQTPLQDERFKNWTFDNDIINGNVVTKHYGVEE